MKQLVIVLAAGFFACVVDSAMAIQVVLEGKAASIIVVPSAALPVVEYAAQELQYHVERATGATLAIVPEDKLPATRAEDVRGRLYLGACDAARKAGIDPTQLNINAFQIKLAGDDLFIVGHDSDGPALGMLIGNRTKVGTLFGVYEWIEKQLKVSWPWPGKLGEVIPKVESINITNQPDQTWTPQWLHSRVRDYHIFGASTDGWPSPEVAQKFFHDQSVWMRRHRFSPAIPMDMRHAFSELEYWERFHDSHPEYFNLLPDGTRRPDPLHVAGNPDHVSMCVSEPALWRQLVADWRQRRAAEGTTGRLVIDASENDTSGKCTCERCLSWDLPDPDLSIPWNERLDHARKAFLDKERYWAILLGRMSDRYGRMYREVLKEAEKFDPNAIVLGLAYDNTNKPPIKTKLEERIVIGIVPAFYFPWTDERRQALRDQWSGWAKTGARLMLRPNFFLDGHNMPMFYADKFGEDFAFAARNGLVATDFDSLNGQWGTQGPNLYMLGRMNARPDLSPDEVLEEYYSAFGVAKDAVRAYFEHWKAVCDAVTVESYDAGWKQAGIKHDPEHFLFLWADAIFTPAACARGRALLDEAAQRARGDQLAEQRVAFIDKGFRHAELSLNALEAYKQFKKDGKPEPFAQAVRKLDAFRASVDNAGISNLGFLMSKEAMFWDRKALAEGRTPSRN